MLYEVITLYESATQEALDAPLQLELLMKLASILDERLEQPERATEFYRKAQELEPDNHTVLDALRITSYNVCYTKLLRARSGSGMRRASSRVS